jgi:hypothetical protein
MAPSPPDARSVNVETCGLGRSRANYPTDMRKANGSIGLWPIQFSDCRADMRKSNMHNDLCQSSILARGGGACARWPEPSHALGSQGGAPSRDVSEHAARSAALIPARRQTTPKSGQFRPMAGGSRLGRQNASRCFQRQTGRWDQSGSSDRSRRWGLLARL